MKPELFERSRPWISATLAGAVSVSALAVFPQLELGLFARAAAWLAALFTGAQSTRVEEGWALAVSGLPVVVTKACSGTDFHALVAVLLGWHFGRGRSLLGAIATSVGVGFLVSTTINAIRIVLVAQAHRWVIPRLPDAYGAFFHLLVGVAVFLPALIALNLALDAYARRRSFIRA